VGSRPLSERYATPPKSSLSSILAKDNEDASLEKYKRQLLGAAATGNLGNVADDRRVVITEFRIIFEDDSKSDVVYSLGNPAGVAHFQRTPFSIVQGSRYKFQISFRVNGEIVMGLRFDNTIKTAIKNDLDSVMLGCYGPLSAGGKPHCFTYPRRGWAEAPSGMMFRGKWRANMAFKDQDGECHLSTDYEFNIVR
jgi:Rho GDP-dissociation inhibitor